MSIKPILLLTDTIDITIDIIDKLVKQNVVVNKKKKNNSDYDSVFPYNDNLALPISQMELDNNSTIPIIVPKKPNSVTPNLTNSQIQ